MRYFTKMNTAKIAVVVATVAAVTGCAKVRIVGREIDPTEEQRVIHRCGWNVRGEDETSEIRVERGKTLGAVKVSMNYLHALGTVLTLGLWMPIDLTWEVNR